MNALGFSLPLLGGEANLADLTILEALRVADPALYESIREARHVLVGAGSHAQGVGSGDALPELPPSDPSMSASVNALLQVLFPTWSPGGAAVAVDSSAEAEYSRSKRICSREYVDRFFLYGVQSGSVSDVLVEQYLADPESSTSRAWLAEQLGERPVDLAYKLRRSVSALDLDASRSIAQQVIEAADSIPEGSDELGLSSNVDLVAMLLVDLCWNEVGEAQREQLFHLVRECSEPNLRLGIVRWACVKDGPSVLSEDEQDAIVVELVDKICAPDSIDALTSSSLPLFVRFVGRAVGHEDLRPVMETWIATPANASRLVTTALASHGRTRLRTGYDLLARFVDPKSLLSILEPGVHDEALEQLRANETFDPPLLD